MSDTNTEVQSPAPMTAMQAQMLKMMQEGSKKKKQGGLGFMWSNATESVGEVFGTVAISAKATRVLAESGLNQALQSKAESGAELLEAYGIVAEGYEAVSAAKLLRDLLLEQ